MERKRAILRNGTLRPRNASVFRAQNYASFPKTKAQNLIFKICVEFFYFRSLFLKDLV